MSVLPAIHADPPAAEGGLSGDVNGAELKSSTIAEPDVSGSVLTQDKIVRFMSHRINRKDSTVTIEVLWKGGGITFEDEYDLHAQVPCLLFDYWKKLEGRDHATGLEEYHVFKIIKCEDRHVNNKLRHGYMVEWVGFPSTEVTWEYAYKIKKNSPGAIRAYQSNQD
ncbi:hypothetical protein FALBO_15725 [Fusarium albosuccineum]|uniref:Chromo domain-containing protein n=1 Tax=Fusarium albosuccineum TaxID=1237068 RepID=A0A8H4KQZ7_9HYPO|nr:hypothetical protein FALBO_15725 [Fusarium albosuccineum]